MEKAERSLLRALQEGLPLIMRINIALDVAEGLKAIHDIGYIYEDLKPGNILVLSVLNLVFAIESLSIDCLKCKLVKHSNDLPFTSFAPN